MTVTFYVRYVYGKPMRYVACSQPAQALAMLTGRKTLTDSDMIALVALGFEMVEVSDERN